MAALGIPLISSNDIVKTFMQNLQAACGVRNIRYKGVLNYVYYASDLLGLISQVSKLDIEC